MSMGIEQTEKKATGDSAMQTGLSRHQMRALWDALTEQRIKRGALFSWAALLMLSAAIMHVVAITQQVPPSALLAVLLISFTTVQAIVAVAVVAAPGRGLLLLAGMIEAVGTLAWCFAHVFGLPAGASVWRPETLGVPDLYLPLVEGISAVFFLCLCGRTWSAAPRGWRMACSWLPRLLLLGLLVSAVLKSVAIVVFFLVPGALSSVPYFFLPVAGLLAMFLLLRLIIRPLRMRTKGAGRTTFTLLPALLVLGILTWGGGVSAIDTAWLSASTPVSVPAGQTVTLQYCQSASGSPLAMDLSEPSAGAPRPAPMVFYIHGGETLVGSRVLKDGSPQGMYLDQLRTDLLARGFVVGSIDYGLVPLASVGDQVKDAKCAVRFLRAHARELGIDPQRIGAYGDSQGGYLSAMLGTVGPDGGYDTGQYLNQSSRVQAVVDMWGPTDLANFSGSPWWASLLVGHATIAQLHNASPLYHVAHGDPPFLIMYGTDDWFIAPHHSQDLAKRLQATNVPVTLVAIQHNGHGLVAPTSGQIEQPAPATLIQMIARFFTRTLGA